MSKICLPEKEVNEMEEKKYDFEEMASDLSCVGNNAPMAKIRYTADLYFRVLDQLEELAELQKQGALTITINK